MAAEARWRRALRWAGRPLASVRARTTLLAVVVVGIALVVGALGLESLLRQSLVDDIDQSARLRALDVAALARSGRLPELIPNTSGQELLVQVIDGSGRIISTTANAQDAGPMLTLEQLTVLDDSGDSARRTVTDLPDRDPTTRYRVVALAVQEDGQLAWVVVARSLEPVDASGDAVRNLLLVGTPVLLAVLAIATWLLVGRALQPVESIRREVADITASRLDRRVPEPAVDDEIGRLARTMNAMLDRLEASTERQRRFVGDASHELQSPLAASRAGLEVALAHPDQADWPATAASALGENERMERLVRDLLFLARSDEERQPVAPARVDLDDVVLAEVGRVRSRAGSVRVEATRVSAALVEGRRDELARVVGNLLENAVRHATERVTVALGVTGKDAVLEVSDDGPGVPPAERERVFERFVRLDDARSRRRGGTGLGLAIVREIVRRHGGSVSVDDAEPGPGARFVVRLPAATE